MIRALRIAESYDSSQERELHIKPKLRYYCMEKQSSKEGLVAEQRTSILSFYTDEMLPALADRLDTAFPEFGWKPDRDGWIATNQERTHRILGVRADRVVAHGQAPQGFLVHGVGPTLWTAYVNGGSPPRGQAFVDAVKDLAERAGVDPAAVEQPRPTDRRANLLHDFFVLCRRELAGAGARVGEAYLVAERGLPRAAIPESGLGLVPPEKRTTDALRTLGYSPDEIAQSGVTADSRWPGRITGAWRDERGHTRTLWARTTDPEADPASKYLYLRGAPRTGLPPYGLSTLLTAPRAERDELVLVEGLLDAHQLRARGFANVAALGGTNATPTTFENLQRYGISHVVLALDNDTPGRQATARAIEAFARAGTAPTLHVLDPSAYGPDKDPDAYVRHHGTDAFRALLSQTHCAITWRALQHTTDITPEVSSRRAALARAGHWLGSLSPRLALEQEDAIKAVAHRCGYSPEATTRVFRARFWRSQERDRDFIPRSVEAAGLEGGR
jgi:5S rRNA maturation endonuclease (ribonuclease M5)